MPRSPYGNRNFELLKQVAAVSTVPLILVGGPLIGYFVGDWLDQRYSWHPYGKFFLIFFGLAASMREIVQMVRQILKSEKK